MMANIMYAACPDIPSVTNLNLNIASPINGGALALSSTPRSLQYIHLMQWGQNRGVTFPSPFNSTVLSAYKIEQMLHWYRLSVLQN